MTMSQEKRLTIARAIDFVLFTISTLIAYSFFLA